MKCGTIHYMRRTPFLPRRQQSAKKVNMKINFKALDKPYFLCYSVIKLIETVDAEIKVIMLPQRARGAVSRVKNKSSNGPLRVQSNG